MDMYTHLQQWITILECELGHEVIPDNYIFPCIGPNGLINPKQAMSHEVVQSLLSEFGQGSRVKGYFTTHSLRRGGAQYWLMYAPLTEH